MTVHQAIEHFASDKEYQPGTVLVFGGDQEVTMSNEYSDTRVAGVVAAIDHLLITPVIVHGRAQCRVVGIIKKGDLLVSSKIPGVAVVPTNNAIAGSIIGKALQEFSSDHIGNIEIAVCCG
jgi:hypothetical protein